VEDVEGEFFLGGDRGVGAHGVGIKAHSPPLL
jgi:hypothetical protein